MTGFKVLSKHFPEGRKKNMSNLSQYNQFPVKDLNSEPPEYEAVVQTTRLQYSANLK